MRNLSLKLSAALLALVSAASPAAAEDRKTYPGIACLATAEAVLNISRTTVPSGNSATSVSGRAFNTSTTATTLICPAVMDEDSIHLGRAYVIDQHQSARITCSLRSISPVASGQWVSSDSTTDAFADSVPTQLTFGSIPGFSDGTYFMVCGVPGVNPSGLRSGIANYHIHEND